MDKWEKHCGKTEPLMIDGDEFQLQQLGTEYIPTFLKLAGIFGNIKTDEDVSEAFNNADEDILNKIGGLIDKTLEISFPDKDKETLKKFGMKYMMVLLPHIMTINSVQTQGMEKTKKMETLQRLQKKKLEDDKPHS